MDVTNGRARRLIKEFGDPLRKKPSYFVAAVSENTEEQIRKYMQDQKLK